tara:strand:+ start:205 stop:876 length:672 start_codon:yes stop_codon:yes gene_type:complete
METDFSKRLKKKKTDKSDFSTDKKKKDLSDFAGKNKIKTNTSKMKNTFSSDAGVKPKASSGKTTFSADTNIAKISSKTKDKSDFAGSNKTKTKTKTKTSTNKPRIVSAKELKASGLSLRDFLNKERGLTRRDGKKAVKKVVKKSSAPKAPPPAPNRGKNKIVPSLKKSSAGIDGGSSQVNRAKKKIVKKNPMSTKTPKTYKGTNITPTKLQRDRMRKRAMGST